MEKSRGIKKIAINQQFVSLFGVVVIALGLFAVWYYYMIIDFRKNLNPSLSAIIILVGSSMVLLDNFIIRKRVGTNKRLFPFLLVSGYILTFAGLIILTLSLGNGFEYSFLIYAGLLSVLMGSVMVISHNLFNNSIDINRINTPAKYNSISNDLEQIKEFVIDEIAKNNKIDNIQSNSNNLAEEKINNEEIDFVNCKKRLEKEIKVLSNRANTNLFIGGIAAIIGVIMLIYFITPANHVVKLENLTIKDAPNLLLSYLPRFSSIILIEIIAFFFLKLYKTTLDDIKYYQNEITNIESQNVALKTSIASNNKELLVYSVKRISETERNFILKKGQSSIELEKLKTESNKSNEIIKTLSTILGKN